MPADCGGNSPLEAFWGLFVFPRFEDNEEVFPAPIEMSALL